MMTLGCVAAFGGSSDSPLAMLCRGSNSVPAGCSGAPGFEWSSTGF